MFGSQQSQTTSETKKSNHALAIFFIIQVVFVVLLAISIPLLSSENRVDENNLTSQPQVSVTELSEDIPDLRPDNLSHIQRALFNIILDGESTADKSLTADIRSDSVTTYYFEDAKTNYFTAVVDVPELDLSYRIYYAYTNPKKNQDPNDNIVILCLDEVDGCKSPYGANDLKRLIYGLLRYHSFDNFTLNLTDTSFTNVGLNLANGATENQNSYFEEIKGYINSLGVSPELFTYYIVQQDDLDYKIFPERQ